MRRALLFLAVMIIVLSLLLIVPFRNAFAVKNNLDSIPFCESRVNNSEIEVMPDKIIININNISIGKFANTTSMSPLITEDSKGIVIEPKSENEIKKGDIIIYEQNSILIVHRVIETGYDNEGWYCITKGDNTQQADGKIRFNQIKSILIGILY